MAVVRMRFVLSGLVAFLITYWTLTGSSYRDFTYRFTSQSPTKPEWSFVSTEAQDKAIIIAKCHNESVDWVSEHLRDWKQAIYYMDEPDIGALHPPINKGREAMAYLTFLIDHYDNLPEYMVFIHPHQKSWPVAWHTDAVGYDNVNSIRSIRLEYLDEHGYMNLRCIFDPGCPPSPLAANDFKMDASWSSTMVEEAWPYMFGVESEVPDLIAQPCCSQFAVTRWQVLNRTQAEYELYRQWLIDTEASDYVSGRVFEYLWHVIFGRPAFYCPTLQKCWCDQFGRC